ncbi:hypothetical protein VI26_17035 [Chromobacterium sp. LK1]|nr:hypothetical protein VI26_17035 [Chromobacterium sp. LK1]
MDAACLLCLLAVAGLGWSLSPRGRIVGAGRRVTVSRGRAAGLAGWRIARRRAVLRAVVGLAWAAAALGAAVMTAGPAGTAC